MTVVTRREFFRHGAAATLAPYVITSAALGSAEKEPASERVTFAVIGLGDRGPTHLGMGVGAPSCSVCVVRGGTGGNGRLNA